MSLKDIDQLTTEIDAAVHSNGPLGKTTAPGLNAVLKSLANELIAHEQQSTQTAAQKADLDSGGRVPSYQLPSYVDDILEAASYATLPTPGETGKIYVAVDTNKQYRWSGSGYALLSDSGLTTDAKAALEASHSPSASNAFVTQAEIAAASSRYADVVSADRVRTYYGSADAAFAAAVTGDTVNLYSPLNLQVPPTSEAVLDMHPGVSANLYGIKVTSPDANHDIITFRGGRQVLNGFNSVLTQNDNGTVGGWFIGTYGGVNVDAYIYDLQLQLLTYNSVGFALFGDGSYFYRGNVTSAGRYVVRLSGTNAQHFTAHGDIIQSGGGTMFLMTNPAATLEWNGNITMTNSCYMHMQAGTVVLREGVLHAENRTPGAETVSVNNGAGTIILENYTVLGIPGKTVLAADKVILRGNSVVVGNIQATMLVDERPATGGSPIATQDLYLQVSSTTTARVAELPVPSIFSIGAEVLDVNAAGITYQLDKNTRSDARIYGASSQTRPQINELLAALTPEDLTLGVKLYVNTVPNAAAAASIIGLTIQ